MGRLQGPSARLTTGLLVLAIAALLVPSFGASAPVQTPDQAGDPGIETASFPTGCDPAGDAFDPSPTFTEPGRLGADARSEPEVLVRLASELEPFDPAALVVDAGTCIVFRNDGPPHTLHVEADTTGNLAVAIEERLDRGETIRVTFQQPGTYVLHCRTHPVLMHGILHVR